MRSKARTHAQAKPTSYHDALLQKIQQLSEYQLTHKIIIPLIKTWGYQNVEYHGGSREDGKDIICWRTDELRDLQVAVAQVKRFAPSARAASKLSLSEIVTQLSQCAEKRIPARDGQSLLPSTIYFITPFKISTRVLQTRFEAVESLRSRNIRIVDGPKLVDLLLLDLRDVALELCGSRVGLRDAIHSELNNDALLNAIQFRNRRRIEDIYTDIDFFLGRPTTRILSLSSFRPRDVDVDLESAQWLELRGINDTLTTSFGVRIYLESDADVERRHAMDSRRHKKWDTEFGTVTRQLRRGAAALVANIERIVASKIPIGDEGPAGVGNDGGHRKLPRGVGRGKAGTEAAKLYAKLTEWHNSLDTTGAASERPRNLAKAIQNTEHTLRDKHRVPTAVLSKFIEDASNYALSLQKQHALMRRRRALKVVPSPLYRVRASGTELKRFLEAWRKRSRATIARYNRRAPRTDALAKFLRDCHRVLDTVSRALANATVSETLGAQKGAQGGVQEKDYRLTIPIHRMFDTGLDLMVLGDAGAGKTTSLQMYAREILSNEGNGKLAIYAPLAKVVRRRPGRFKRRQRQGGRVELEEGLALYLKTRGISITRPELVEEFEKRAYVLLFDGVDEISKEASWIVDAMSDVSAKYPRIQIITSSRIVGERIGSSVTVHRQSVVEISRIWGGGTAWGVG